MKSFFIFLKKGTKHKENFKSKCEVLQMSKLEQWEKKNLYI